MVFGDFDLSYFVNECDTSPIAVVCFSLYMLLTSVIMLNLLIAIISDSFDVVNEKQKAQLLRNRATLILENEGLLSWWGVKPKHGWVHALVRSSLRVQKQMDVNANPSNTGDAFTSRLKVLKDKIASMKTDLKGGNDQTKSEVKAEVQAVKADVKAEVQAV